MQAYTLIDTGRSKFWVVPNFTPDYYYDLTQLPVNEEPPIVVYGKTVKQNRDISFFSDESIGYKYSGQMMPSIPLKSSRLLSELLPAVNKILGTQFNGILLNRYRSGEKSIGSHSDDEKALDKNRKMVAGLAYGPGIRKFRIRDKKTNKIVLDYDHQPCTLIAMEGDFQSEFKHEIPKQLKVKGERISITFRHHLE
mgnify:FL=1